MQREQTQTGPQRLRILLEPDADAPAAARRALRSLPLGQGCDDVLLLATELITNAVLHAALEPGGEIELSASCDPACTHVEVRDNAVGFDAVALPSGYGLRMLAEASERWGVEHDGSTAVWFDLRR